jgi:hypothetical protein
MNKKSILQGVFIAFFCLFMTYSYGQLAIALGVKVKGTSSVVWDAANNRYLYSYQDISYDIMGIPVINEASIYQCDRDGKNPKIFSTAEGLLQAPTGLVIKGDYLYIADWINIFVVKLSDGQISDNIMFPGKGCQDICSDGVNTLYATDIMDDKIYWINMTTKEFDTLAVDTNGVSMPCGIYFENTPKKSLFVCSFKASSPIQRYDFSGDSLYIIKRTSYRYCYDIGGDGKGNYFLSDWKSTGVNAGTIYKFIGGWDVSLPFVNYLNFPAEPFYQTVGDTLVYMELNKAINKTTPGFAPASRDLIKPEVDTVLVANSNTIVVYFDEPVNATALDPLRYGGVGSFSSITRNASNTEVTLNLNKALTLNLKTPFSVSNVQDMAGNSMKQPYTIDLIYKTQSILDNYLKSGLTVYPNPVRNKININYELLQSADVSIDLYDILGNNVATLYNGNQNPGNYDEGYQLPKNNLSNGFYILKFTVDGQIYMSKIMVER